MNKILLSVSALLIAGASMFILNNQPSAESTYVPRDENANNPALSWEGAAGYLRSIRANPATGKIDPKDVRASRLAVNQARSKKSAVEITLNWTHIGPNDVGGRTRAILIDKDDHNTVYTGGVSGGLWKSSDGGAHWSPIDDDSQVAMVASLAQAADGTIYVGTGSTFDGATGYGSSGFVGNGVFKLNAAGNGFDQLTGTLTGSEWGAVNTLQIHPLTGDIYAGTGSGLRVSSDGGTTWNNPIKNQAANCAFDVNGEIEDIEIADDGTIILSLNGTIYVSPDGSDCSFTQVTNGNTPLKSGRQRINLAMSAQDNNYVYAIASQGGELDGLYRSLDKGQTWILLQGQTSGFHPLNTQGNPQGNYDLLLGVSPHDKEFVILGGIALWKWDGDISQIATLFNTRHGFGLGVHADKHAIAFDKTDPNIIYFGTDGGIAKTFDRTVSYATYNNNYDVTQFYDVAVDIDGKVMGGAQDNNSIQVKPWIGQNSVDVLGGDGFDANYSQLTNIRFAASQTGNLSRGTDNSGMSGICPGGTNPICSQSFYTTHELWESINDPLSKRTIEFIGERVEHSIANGNGSKVSFSGVMTPGQDVAKIKPGTIIVFAGTQQTLHDVPDSVGSVTGTLVDNDSTGTGTVNYNTKEFTVHFAVAPPNQMPISVSFGVFYEAGSTLVLKSHANGLNINHLLTSNVEVGDTITVIDPINDLLVMSGNNNDVLVNRDGLIIGAAVSSSWLSIPGISGNIHAIAFSKDGNHLFLGIGNQFGGSGKVYRVSGLKDIYSQDDIDTNFPPTVTQIYSGGNAVTGVAVDFNNAQNVVITTGGYTGSQKVFKTTTGISASSSSGTFTNIQGDLPGMPVYDAIIDLNNPTRVVLGTEHGVWSTDNYLASSVVWVDQSNPSMANVPVFAVVQQQIWWSPVAGNIYLGTHGRGFWMNSDLTVTSVNDNFEGIADGTDFITDLNIYPNPMSNSGFLALNVKERAKGDINIYNLSGTLVKAMRNVQFNNGDNNIRIESDGLAAGTYFVNLQINGNSKVAKFVVAK